MTTPAITAGSDPFQLFQRQGTIQRLLNAASGNLLGLSTLSSLYGASHGMKGETFSARALRALDICVAVSRDDVPRSGPVIVAANHPRGVSDGLALMEALREVRPDVRLLVNHLLDRIPELHETCFFVDPFGGPGAVARSRAGLRAAHLWLRGGGALIVFPAGMVAPHLARDGEAQDAPWQLTVGRLALATRAAVIPAFISGHNSHTFYRMGRVHPLLRTALLGRELLRQRRTTIPVTLGQAFRTNEFEPAAAVDATAAIRRRVEALANTATSADRAPLPIVPPTAPADLRADVLALHAVASVGPFDVFCEEAAVIPRVLQEIGRLRELTFRAVGEGTGQPLDLDRFDTYYRHLFAWNRATHEVVGAYRIGRTDEILARHGVRGLYTSTLFRYDERLLRRLSPALELGRSFVRREYQRSPLALLALWKGIGQLVAHEPRYRTLFGPVSISSRYRDTSQQMLLDFLIQNHRDAELAELVQALNPPSLRPLPGRASGTAADVDALIAGAEPDGTGMPVLLRQYLRLNARVLGFNVDPAFGDALDALLTVDLTEIDPAILARYLGKHGASAFVAYHQRRAA